MGLMKEKDRCRVSPSGRVGSLRPFRRCCRAWVLAYAMDGQGRCWGITRAAAARAFDALSVGDRVTLVVEQHDGFAIASGCLPMQPHA